MDACLTIIQLHRKVMKAVACQLVVKSNSAAYVMTPHLVTVAVCSRHSSASSGGLIGLHA
jgi:hypothetical protein